MKYGIAIIALVLSTLSASADTVCVPTSNGGYRCTQTNSNPWQGSGPWGKQHEDVKATPVGGYCSQQCWRAANGTTECRTSCN